MTLHQEEIVKEFENARAILKGHFLLSSGLHSDTYLQCARVLMDTNRSERLCQALAKKVEAAFSRDSFDIIIAPAMGGVIVGYEMGRQLQAPTFFCERVDGEFTLRRGFEIEAGQRVLVVEDVVTTGKSSIETIDCVTRGGGEVIGEACLVHRVSPNTPRPELGVPLVSLLELEVSTYTKGNLPTALQDLPAIKPGSRWLQDQAKG